MDLTYLLSSALAVIGGIVIHESAHALAAYVLGDRTARSRGRVSLNPLAHIDPFGTVLLPLLMMAAGGPVFAFAKPVPVYLGNLKHPKRDEVLVSFAGPASNLLLAFMAALVLKGLVGLPAASGSNMVGSVAYFCLTCISVNRLRFSTSSPCRRSTDRRSSSRSFAVARYLGTIRFSPWRCPF